MKMLAMLYLQSLTVLLTMASISQHSDVVGEPGI